MAVSALWPVEESAAGASSSSRTELARALRGPEREELDEACFCWIEAISASSGESWNVRTGKDDENGNRLRDARMGGGRSS